MPPDRKPLKNPFIGYGCLVLVDNGAGELYWIDEDGDLCIWEQPEPPDTPYVVRRSPLLATIDRDDNSEVEAAFRASTSVLMKEWDALFETLVDNNPTLEGKDSATLDYLKEAGRTDWNALLKDVSLNTVTAWIKTLDHEMMLLASLRGYLEGRTGHGYGDQGHAEAVAECNRVHHKVRLALGYQNRLDIKF